jgi:hypothetical protein
VALTASAAACPADAAVARTDGADFVQLHEGHGYASIRVRGNFFGHVDSGRIVATANVSENGCEAHKPLNHGFRLCRGHDITFRTPVDSRWRVRLRGHGISATGFVRGCLRLDGRNAGPTGSYKLGFDGPAKSWPRRLRRYRLGSGSC